MLIFVVSACSLATRVCIPSFLSLSPCLSPLCKLKHLSSCQSVPRVSTATHCFALCLLVDAHPSSAVGMGTRSRFWLNPPPPPRLWFLFQYSEGSTGVDSSDDGQSHGRPGNLTRLGSQRRPGLAKRGSSRRFHTPSPLMDDRSQAFFLSQSLKSLSRSGGTWTGEVSLVDVAKVPTRWPSVKGTALLGFLAVFLTSSVFGLAPNRSYCCPHTRSVECGSLPASQTFPPSNRKVNPARVTLYTCMLTFSWLLTTDRRVMQCRNREQEKSETAPTSPTAAVSPVVARPLVDLDLACAEIRECLIGRNDPLDTPFGVKPLVCKLGSQLFRYGPLSNSTCSSSQLRLEGQIWPH